MSEASQTPGRLSRLINSSIGAKIVMATTGVVLVGFLLVHMGGNLQIYVGPEKFNGYAQGLKHTPALVWAVRLVLLSSIGAHIWAALKLKGINSAARPRDYATPRTYRKTNAAARMMLLSGLVILAFVVYHILHFTVGVIQQESYHLYEMFDVATQSWIRVDNPAVLDKLSAHMVRHDAYSMFVRGFQHPLVAGSYVVANLLLGMHLAHAIGSMLHTLGLSKGAQRRRTNERIGAAIATLLVLGNLSFPIAVQAGLVHL